MASIRKRTWTTKAGEAKTAWLVDYSDQSGKRHVKTFTRKRDADAWMVDARHEIRQGTHTADSASPTLSDAADAWIERTEARGRERVTTKQYREQPSPHLTGRPEQL